MTLGKVNHLHFFVEDLEETLKFFTEKMGFELVRRGHEGQSVDLVSLEGGPTFEFMQITEEYKTAKPPEKLPSKKPGISHFAAIRRPYLDHVAFEVDDMDRTCKEMKSKGVKFIVKPTINPVNKRKLADVCDADGHGWIQLQEKGSEKEQK